MFPVVNAVLKRGALVTAANGEPVLPQFVAEASLEVPLAVPLALFVGTNNRAPDDVVTGPVA